MTVIRDRFKMFSFSVMQSTFCFSDQDFGGSPEILEIMALFSSSHHATSLNLLKSFAIYPINMLGHFH